MIKGNFRPGTKISGRLDHCKMHNRLCGKPAASEMFPGTIVLRNCSKIWEVWQFSINPQSPRVYGKLQNIPKMASVSQNYCNWKIIFFSCFGFFCLNLKKMSLTFCPKIFSWLPHMYSDSKKIGTKTRFKIFHGGTLRGGHLDSEKPMGFCYPACMGLPWKI